MIRDQMKGFARIQDLTGVIIVSAFVLVVAAGEVDAATFELFPSPVNGGTITINNGDIGQNNADPYQNFGTIDAANGGTFENFETFEILNNGVLSTQLGGTINNFKTIQSEDLGPTITNAGTLNNWDSLGNGYHMTNHATGVINNNPASFVITKVLFTNNGTVHNAGSFDNFGSASGDFGQMDNNAGAVFNNLPGGEYSNSGNLINRGTFNNEGIFDNTISFSGIFGKMENIGVFNNFAGGSVDNRRRFNNSGTLNNDSVFTTGNSLVNLPGGVFNNNAGGSLDFFQTTVSNFGTFNNAGFVRVRIGFVNKFSGSGTYTQAGGTTVVNNTLEASAIDFQGGRLRGTGSLIGPVTVGPGATISPGYNFPDIPTIFLPRAALGFDSLTMTGGIFVAEIGGLIAGTDHDQLAVTGAATLAGRLDLSIPNNGFSPTIGDSFDVVTGLSVTGTFGQVTGKTIDGTKAFDVTYLADRVRVQVIAAIALAGDLDGDGFVGIADLNLVLGQWNQLVTAGIWSLGDPSADGFVGIEDLNTVLSNWNAGAPPPAEAISQIPEPGTLGLLAIGLGVWGGPPACEGLTDGRGPKDS